MNKIFSWAKAHPAATAAIVLIGGVIFYLILRGQGSGATSGVAQLAQTQAATQAQTDQLNAQLSAQTQQTQAQLQAQEIQASTQAQAQQDTIAGQVISEQLSLQPQLQGQELQAELLKEQLANQSELQASLTPLEQQALNISKMGNRATTGQNELALLLQEGGSVVVPPPNPGAGFTLNIPGVGGLGVTGL